MVQMATLDKPSLLATCNTDFCSINSCNADSHYHLQLNCCFSQTVFMCGRIIDFLFPNKLQCKKVVANLVSWNSSIWQIFMSIYQIVRCSNIFCELVIHLVENEI